jgi:acyl-coenzyme A synthetase/AMP-(fatty) acid ligase
MALWQSLARAAGRPAGALSDRARTVPLELLESASCLGGRLEELRGRSVVLAARDQLSAALALIELDGIARRMVLCPPDLPAEHLPHVLRSAQADTWIGDAARGKPPEGLGIALELSIDPVPRPGTLVRQADRETEWILLTSGTTGAPKLVLHTFASLISAFAGRPSPPGGLTVWSSFYDVRRYGGLQIFLRALLGGSLVLSDPAEPVGSFFARAAAAGVTHISGTPSHWRKALMSGAATTFRPSYVRLSGEIADQGILDALKAAFPQAVVAHAFASTEAGVGFEVRDGLAGFPASLVGISENGVEVDTRHGTLRLRSSGNAIRYLGEGAPPLKDPEGFVDMGDRLELRSGRYYFKGRSGGIINVGGLKVHPEEVEAVINAHPRVRMSLVKARRNPIMGAVVIAEVVLAEDGGIESPANTDLICQQIQESCRAALSAHKVPAQIRIVRSLAVSASGKLVRPNA